MFTFRCVGYNRGRHPKLPVEHCASLLIANRVTIYRAIRWAEWWSAAVGLGRKQGLADVFAVDKL